MNLQVAENPTQAVNTFFEVFDAQVTSASLNQSGVDLLPQNVRDLTSEIAVEVCRLFKEDHDASADIEPTMEEINAVLATIKDGLALRGDPDVKQGYYTRLSKISPVTEGQPQGVLVFAVIPEGHQAPKHWHVSGGTDLPGELTETLVGELKWREQVDGEVFSTCVGDGVRVSQHATMDDYQTQTSTWVGIYVQFVPCVFNEPEVNC